MIMKKIITIIAGFGLLLTTSCVDLNMKPVDAYSSSTFFVSQQAAFSYLTACYAAANLSGQFTGGNTGDNYMFDAVTDNGVSWPPNGLPSFIALGTAVATQGGYYHLWNDTWPYIGIRNDNFFLENVDKTTGLDEATATLWKAEARFLRAFDYARKYMCYGGVPLVTKVLDYGEEIDYPRVSGDTIYNFVINELNEVAPLLPAANPGADASRATRGAALALKTRIELFHGSMKMVGLADGVTEPNGKPDNQAAIASLKAAVQDAQALISLGEYGIANDYEGLYLESAQGGQDRQKEVIFEVAYQYSESGIASSWILPWYTNLEGGWNLVVPTQNMVDEYETSNGKLTTDPSNSMYDINQPYLNRDPRFYATIIYPGRRWNDRWWSSLDNFWPNATTTNIEYYNSTESHHPLTGYCLAKWAAPQAMLMHDATDNQAVNYIVFRHAEVLLNYAEALIELNKLGDPSGDLNMAANLINQVRQRGTSPCPLDGYGNGTITYTMPPITASNATEMEAQVRHERRVELAFDGLRWYDLKRWKTLEKVMPGPVYGVCPGTVDISDIDPVSNSAKVKFTDPTKHILATQDRVFNPQRDYFWPLNPNDVITENGVLIQNPNW